MRRAVDAARRGSARSSGSPTTASCWRANARPRRANSARCWSTSSTPRAVIADALQGRPRRRHARGEGRRVPARVVDRAVLGRAHRRVRQGARPLSIGRRRGDPQTGSGRSSTRCRPGVAARASRSCSRSWSRARGEAEDEFEAIGRPAMLAGFIAEAYRRGADARILEDRRHAVAGRARGPSTRRLPRTRRAGRSSSARRPISRPSTAGSRRRPPARRRPGSRSAGRSSGSRPRRS